MRSDQWDGIWARASDRLDSPLLDAVADIERSEYARHVAGVLSGISGPVLEAGCGQGIWLEWLARVHHRRAVGLDYAMGTLSRLHGCRPDFILAAGDVLSLPFSDGSFALVMSWGVIEHFYDPDQAVRALREAGRVLMPGGWLCMTVPLRNWVRTLKTPFRRVKNVLRVALKHADLKEEFFEREYRRSSLLDLLRGTGYEPAVVEYNAPGFGLTNEYPFTGLRRVGPGGEYAGLTRAGELLVRLAVKHPAALAHMIFVAAHKAGAERQT